MGVFTPRRNWVRIVYLVLTKSREKVTMPESYLHLEKVSKSYNGKKVLDDVSFAVRKGSITSIFGPNASGKTTLLNIISGLDHQDAGSVLYNGNGDSLPLQVSYVFQNYTESLLPWRTVEHNIALPLKLRGIPARERSGRVRMLVEKYRVDIDLDKFPYQLSGGQQQLVAILRALIVGPDLLLLDEPFSAIDFQKKLYLHRILLEIWEQTGTTILLISHDMEEAIYLADTVLLLGGAPAHILMNLPNDLPRPRQPDMVALPEFARQKGKLLECFLKNATILRL